MLIDNQGHEPESLRGSKLSFAVAVGGEDEPELPRRESPVSPVSRPDVTTRSAARTTHRSQGFLTFFLWRLADTDHVAGPRWLWYVVTPTAQVFRCKFYGRPLFARCRFRFGAGRRCVGNFFYPCLRFHDSILSSCRSTLSKLMIDPLYGTTSDFTTSRASLSYAAVFSTRQSGSPRCHGLLGILSMRPHGPVAHAGFRWVVFNWNYAVSLECDSGPA